MCKYRIGVRKIVSKMYFTDFSKRFFNYIKFILNVKNEFYVFYIPQSCICTSHLFRQTF